MWASTLQSESRAARNRLRASRLQPQVQELEDRTTPSGTIRGVVYQDFNSTGQRDLNFGLVLASGFGDSGVVTAANDRGLAGITVIAVDSAGLVQGTAVTAANGSYVLNAAGTGPYRIEFTNLPAGFTPGPHGPQNGTTVQFVPDGITTDVSLGLVRGADFTQPNPPLVANQYVFGDQVNGPNAALPVLLSFPYNAGASDATLDEAPYLQPSPTVLATASQIGTTWGLAYNNTTRTIYAGAFTKKFAGYGPNGPGAIYQIGVNGAPTLFADLNAIFPGSVPNFRQGYTSPNDFLADNFNTGWDAVGKSALGGMDVSDDGRFLYVMNLADRNLYILPTSGPLNATTVRRVAVPNPITTANSLDPNLDFRPFAVEFHNGLVYIGAVNNAESTQNQSNLRAFVLAFDPVSMTFSPAPVLQFDLNYPRGVANDFDGTAPVSANWLPWSPTFITIDPSGNFGNTIYPQPMLTGLAFDATNNLVLGFRDRAGDQTGVFTPDDPTKNPNLANPGELRRGVTAGDTLRAAFNPATGIYTLETNGSVGGNISAGAGNGQGPGGGEFYFEDNQPRNNVADPNDPLRNSPNIHDEVSVGGVAQVPGLPDVAVTAFNPIRLRGTGPFGGFFNRGGIRLFNNFTGATDTAYQLFETPFPASPGQGFTTFAKANGVGDLIALSDPAPVEIGNRVWFDLDRDGIQDPNEPAISGVTVHLYASDRALLATAITDANGNYYFSNDPRGISTASSIYGIAGLTFNTAGFSVRLDNPADYASGGALNGLQATLTAVGDNRSIDSNGVAFSPTDTRAAVNIGAPGANDHTFDFGFVTPPPVPPPPPPPPGPLPPPFPPGPVPPVVPVPPPGVDKRSFLASTPIT